jgi:hypothetical protein
LNPKAIASLEQAGDTPFSVATAINKLEGAFVGDGPFELQHIDLVLDKLDKGREF